MPHEGAAPGTPGEAHAPPSGYTAENFDRAIQNALTDARLLESADSSGFTPSESIFGWSWLGEWAKNAPNADPKAAAFLQEWVDKFY